MDTAAADFDGRMSSCWRNKANSRAGISIMLDLERDEFLRELRFSRNQRGCLRRLVSPIVGMIWHANQPLEIALSQTIQNINSQSAKLVHF